MRFIIHYCTEKNGDVMHEVFGNFFEIQKRVAEMSVNLNTAIDLMVVESSTRYCPDGNKINIIDDNEIFE